MTLFGNLHLIVIVIYSLFSTFYARLFFLTNINGEQCLAFYINRLFQISTYCVESTILSPFTRIDPTKDKNFLNFIVSGTSIRFPSHLNLSAIESVLSLDPGAWHRLLLGLLGITSTFSCPHQLLRFARPVIGLRLNVASIS